MSFEGKVEAAAKQPLHALWTGGTRLSLAWAITALVVAAAILQQSLIGLDTDVSWLITVGERVLAGERLYVDIFEVNPPASVWIYLPLVWLAEIAGAKPEAVVAAAFVAAALAS